MYFVLLNLKGKFLYKFAPACLKDQASISHVIRPASFRYGVCHLPSLNRRQVYTTYTARRKMSIVGPIQAKLVGPVAYPLKTLKLGFSEMQLGASNFRKNKPKFIVKI